MESTEFQGEGGFPLGGKRIGILGKGGAGKSTVSVLLARELALRGNEVCLLDADSSNVGIHQALGFQDPPTSLMQLFGGMVFSGGRVSCPVDDPTPIPEARLSLETLPEAYYRRTSDGVFLLSGGKLEDFGPGAGCDGPVAKVARDLEVEGETDRIVTLVDFKAGMEDLTRGVITSLDWAVLVVDPSLAAIRMVKALGSMVTKIRDGVPPATAHLDDPAQAALAVDLFRKTRMQGVLVVLNRLPDISAEVHLAGKISKKPPIELIGSLREDSTVGQSWFDGHPLRSPENEARIRGIIDRIEAIESRKGDPREVLLSSGFSGRSGA